MNEEQWLMGLNHLSFEQVIQVHFGLQEKIKEHYKKRATGDNLNIAIELCKQQIALSSLALQSLKKKHEISVLEYESLTNKKHPSPEFFVPRHHGYTQYRAILKKSKKFTDIEELDNKMRGLGWMT